MSKKQVIKFEERIHDTLTKVDSGMTSKELSRHLNVNKQTFKDFRRALDRLRSARRILRIKKNRKYIIAPQARTVSGELRLTRGGFGFVHDEDKNVDVFVSRDGLGTAFDRDIVEVQLLARYRGKNQEGTVTKVVKRFRNHYVGTFHATKYYGYVTPDDSRINRDFLIPKEKQNGAENGHKVLVSLDRWSSDHMNPEGSIVEIIGFAGDPGVDVESIAHSFQLGIKFPANIEKEAHAIPDAIAADEVAGRMDLRELVCFTIDPVDAKDFDDAVSLTKLDNGNRELGVHIADVSHYVSPGTELDKEALKRGTSVYLVDRVIPMLPERLSNGLCSLSPDTEKLTMTCFMELDRNLEVVNYRIGPSVIHSKKRFTYEEVQQIVDGKMESPFESVLKDMMTLSQEFTRKRFGEGGIDFDTPEVGFEFDETGFPSGVHRKERLGSHRLVEEFMLMANKTVAKHIRKISGDKSLLPFVYRIHERPDPEKLNKFFRLLTALGHDYKPVKRITSQKFQEIMASIKGSPEELVIEEVALRSMMKAVYSTKNVGHFGLGFDDYTHFTSPIRRYPDLAVHRLLKFYASGEPVQNQVKLRNHLKEICDQSTKMERLALEAERDSTRLKLTEYISRHIGEEFDGIISGVMPYGVFVELIETLVEGLVPVESIHDDYYIHDETTYSLIGRDTERVLRLGDTVRVRVAKVDLEAGKVDFELLDDETE
jgi:ribonuclease R